MGPGAGRTPHAGAESPIRIDRFVLHDLLGVGGSASVYSATDLRDGARVALKVLSVESAGHADRRAAFLREAEAAAAVAHPGAIRVLSSGEGDPGGTPTRPWIAMELLTGATLSTRVRDRGPLSPADALVLAAGLLRVLEAAHRAGVVHRDVTPANVMLGADPHEAVEPASVRLIDFGLAAAPGERAVDGELDVLGNPHYLSPEHARGLPVREAGDLYQLGGLLHFALTGAPPFLGDEPLATMRAHVSAEPTPPSLLAPGLPEELDAVVLRALQKDPAARFASAAEMLLAVEHARAALRRVRATSFVDAAPDAARIHLAEAPIIHESVTDRLPILRPPAPRTRAQRVEDRKQARIRARREEPGRTRRGGVPLGIAGVAVFAAALGLAATATLQSGIAPGIASSSRTPAAPPRPAATAPPSDVPTLPAPNEPAAPAARVVMPAVVGLSLADARERLEELGLRIGGIAKDPSARAADTVLASSEDDGAELARGSEVRLTVASGANWIPSVAGMTGQQARAALLDAGFLAALAETPAPTGGGTGGPGTGDPGSGTPTPEPGSPQPGTGETPPAPDWSDLIHHTTPEAGVLAPLGSTITLVARARTQPDPAPPGAAPPPAR